MRVGVAIALALTTILLLPILIPIPHIHRPLVLTYYYVWYGRGLGHRHWNDTPAGEVIDVPLLGFYSSYSTLTIVTQLALMKLAGIDGVIVSWWGPGSYEDRVAKRVFRYLRIFGLKGCIMIEPFITGSVTRARDVYNSSFWSHVLSYIEKNFIEPYPHTYIRIDGKPLVLAFAPVGVFYRPHPKNLVIRIVGLFVDQVNQLSSITGARLDWDLWPWYIPLSRGFHGLRIRVGGYVALSPRYDPAIEVVEGTDREDPLVMDRSYTHLTYLMEWIWVVKHLDSVRIVAIYSWNEYHERSEIEPHIYATGFSGLYPYIATLVFANLAHLLGSWLSAANLLAQANSY